MSFGSAPGELGRVHGSSIASSPTLTDRTPRTPCSLAARARTESTASGLMRSMPARMSMIRWGHQASSTKTLAMRSPAFRCNGKAIRLPKPPFGRVSWLGNSRSIRCKGEGAMPRACASDGRAGNLPGMARRDRRIKEDPHVRAFTRTLRLPRWRGSRVRGSCWRMPWRRHASSTRRNRRPRTMSCRRAGLDRPR